MPHNSSACTHAEQGMALYNPQQHSVLAFRYGQDHGVACLAFAAWALWHRGYPEQALVRSREALTLAGQLAHPHSMVLALYFAAVVQQLRRQVQATQTAAEATVRLATEQGFAFYAANGTVQHGWALAVQGQDAEGLHQMHQGLAAYQATGATLHGTYFLARLAEVRGSIGQVKSGLNAVRRSPWSGGPPGVWHACGSTRASGQRPTRCSRRCTAGSPRGLTCLTSRRPRRCSKRWQDNAVGTTPRVTHRPTKSHETRASITPWRRRKRACTMPLYPPV